VAAVGPAVELLVLGLLLDGPLPLATTATAHCHHLPGLVHGLHGHGRRVCVVGGGGGKGDGGSGNCQHRQPGVRDVWKAVRAGAVREVKVMHNASGGQVSP